ncbi:MAG: Formyltetrahydrofolate deformylase [Verrucomicrobiota bacterium]
MSGPEQSEGARLVGLLHGPDQPGLVARTANWIYERGGNILHADQHRDDESGIFFQRIEWCPLVDSGREAADFTAFVEAMGMAVRVSDCERLPRVAIFVSKIEHCYLDLLARWQMGEFPGQLSLVVSNHETLRGVTDYHELPFHHVPVSPLSKADSERRQIELLRANRIDLVVMARYMQVLSGDFLDQCGCPVINIHHSFLPAFAGARPYHQAHSRGVKLIGATAHYATAVLDDGPIIQQGVSPVNHRHSVSDLVRRGRDLEKTVLAQAVRWHLEHRVLIYGNKTVVFD